MIRSALLSCVVLLAPTRASAQDAASDRVAPPIEATVTVTTSEVPPPPTVAVPPPPTSYAVASPRAYVPPPVRDPATRPSFGTSIALHVAAAIAGPLGLAGLVFGSIWALLCSGGSGLDGCGVTSAAIVIAGGVLETASIALGISATAVHGHTRARVREWELGTAARFLPWAGPTGGGATFVLEL